MTNYKLSNEAKNDLIRIHQYGVQRFGMAQADKYFHSFFISFENIAQRPFSFESIDFIKPVYRRCVSDSDNIYFKIKENTVEIISTIDRQDLETVL
jgi:toxin ParE1/3/4